MNKDTQQPEHILIVDDEENMRHMLATLLERRGYQIGTAANGAEALKALEKNSFDYVLCDVRMPKMNGLAFLKAAQKQKNMSDVTMIMMSAYASIDIAIESMKAGAYDFITKPFKPDEVLLTLKKAREREQLRRENKALRQQVRDLSDVRNFDSLITISPVMQELISLAARVAQYDTTVLITGESGTGKELVARGIHKQSPRSEKSFVAVNCGSVPESLLESEFFGHVKGAFTGADQARKGLFAEADGGTLLLDEIGELPLSLQVKLLRVLQENEIRPVGSSRPVQVNVRVIAATARNLEKEIKAERFRDDLFFRLNIIHVQIPPLRERKEDIPPLCRHFLEKFNGKLQRNIQRLTPEAMSMLTNHNWPGNVRELENTMERAVILAAADELSTDSLPPEMRQEHTSPCLDNPMSVISIKKAQKIMEKTLISRALRRTGGNKSQAAKLLEISYPSLLSKIRSFKLEQGTGAK